LLKYSFILKRHTVALSDPKRYPSTKVFTRHAAMGIEAHETETRHDTMAGDQIDPQRGSFGRRVAFFFGALPGSKWIAKGIPLLPGDGSPHERDLNLLIAPIGVLKVFGS
jgi:hypothetical protein